MMRRLGFSKASLSLRRLLFLAISLLTVMVCSFAMAQAFHQWQRVHALQSLIVSTDIGNHLFDASEKIAVEREVTFAMLRSSDPAVIDRLRPLMEENRQKADAEFDVALKDLQAYPFDDVRTALQNCTDRLKSFRDLRALADAALAAKGKSADKDLPQKWFDGSTALVISVQDLWMTFSRHYVDIDSISALQMRLKHLLGIIMEYTGRERAVIGGLIVGVAPATPVQQSKLLRWQGITEISWKLSNTLMSMSGVDGKISPYLTDAQSHYTNGYNMVKELFYIPGAQQHPPYPITIDLWLELSLQEIESLHDLKDAVIGETRLHDNALIDAARQAIILQVSLAGASLLLCVSIFFFVDRSVIRPIGGIVESLHRVTRGEDVDSAPATGSHFREIDTLVQVLAAFQEKALETKQAAADLARHAAQLERTNAELDQFAYVASHDLKAPLRGIDNLAIWIEEDSGDTLPESARNHLKILRGRVARLEDLLTGILSYSRAGKIVEEMIEIDTAALARQVADTWVPVSFKVTIGALPVLKAPRIALEQIFGNICSNAAKHHDKKEGTIRISASDAGAFWQYEIADDGPGIPAAFREKVFEMFRTLKPRDVVEGSGLGMPIAKKLIESVGGKIWVKDQPDTRGTTICFLWPK